MSDRNTGPRGGEGIGFKLRGDEQLSGQGSSFLRSARWTRLRDGCRRSIRNTEKGERENPKTIRRTWREGKKVATEKSMKKTKKKAEKKNPEKETHVGKGEQINVKGKDSRACAK